MRPVAVNFRPHRVPTRQLWLLSLLACSLGALALLAAWTEQRAARSAQAELERAVQAQQLAANNAPAATARQPYEQSARAMLGERALRWPDALRALEASSMDGATLKSFEANAADAAIRAELVLGSHAQIADYLSALSAGTEGRAGPLVWTVLQTSAEQGTGAVTAALVARPPAADGATPRGP